MLTLYDSQTSGNAYKARLIFSHLKLPYKKVPIDTRAGGHKDPAFATVNPNMQVPVVVMDDGWKLMESDAILWYYAQDTPYWPKDRREQAKVMEWLFFEQYTHEPTIAVSRAAIMYNKPDKAAILAAKREGGLKALAVMEQNLAKNRFMAGDRYTIADMALYAYTHTAPEGGLDLAPYPNIRAWLGRVRDQPGHVAQNA